MCTNTNKTCIIETEAKLVDRCIVDGTYADWVEVKEKEFLSVDCFDDI